MTLIHPEVTTSQPTQQPPSINDIPTGLVCLAQLDQVMIKQEVFYGFPTLKELH